MKIFKSICISLLLFVLAFGGGYAVSYFFHDNIFNIVQEIEDVVTDGDNDNQNPGVPTEVLATLKLPDELQGKSLGYSKVSDNLIVIYASTVGVWYYNLADDSCIKMISTAATSYTITKFTNYCTITMGQTAELGLYILRYDNLVSGCLVEDKVYLNVQIAVDSTEDLLVVSSSLNASNSTDAYLCDTKNITGKKIIEGGYNYRYVTRYNNKLVITSSVAAGAGINVYDMEIDNLTVEYESAYYLSVAVETERYLYLSSGTTATACAGLYVINKETNQIYFVHDSGYSYAAIIELENNAFISSTVSSVTGLLQLPFSSMTATKSYTTGYNYYISDKLADNCYIFICHSGSASRILMYNVASDAVTQIESTTTNMYSTYYIEYGVGIYYTNNGSSGTKKIYYYDLATGKVSTITSVGTGNACLETADSVWFYGLTYIVHLDKDTKTITVVFTGLNNYTEYVINEDDSITFSATVDKVIESVTVAADLSYTVTYTLTE